MEKIKILTLKQGMVTNHKYFARPMRGESSERVLIEGDPLKYEEGLPILIDEVEHFVYSIKFHRKDSDFVKKYGLATGCYVIHFAAGSKDYCMGNPSKRFLTIMEDVVATILF